MSKIEQPSAPVEVLRHRAAIRRTEPSLPLKCLIRDNLLNDSTTFFDYGCGYGDDLDQVRRMGVSATGWDPAYRSKEQRLEADVVNLGYVINVIEHQAERAEVLNAAWQLSRSLLVVAARISVDGVNEGEFEFGDGVITRIQTFQKYYTQQELRTYIEHTLSVEAVPAAPGVFYVFRNSTLRETFSAARFRRRTLAPRRRIAEIEFDRNRELLESLINVASGLGRLPFHDEFERTGEVLASFGTMKRAFRLIRRVTGGDPWDVLRRSKIDDLRVYLALARFPKRPKFAQMPVPIQRDIKEFFGGYKNGCEAADALLFEAGQSDAIDAACQRSTVGRLSSNALYVHRSAIGSLEPVLRVFEGCARAYIGELDEANVIKLHRFSGKVSYLVCPQFDEHPHTPVRKSFKVSLRNLFVQCIDYTDNKNPLLLDQKERMVDVDHPWRARFARFTLQEAQHGLLDDSQDLMPMLQWHHRMKDAGLMVRGFRLLYREGVSRRRLPPKHLFQEMTATVGQAEDNQGPSQSTKEFYELPADSSIDTDAEDAAFQERPDSLPSKSKRFGVGKEIGYAVYVHRAYEDVLGPSVQWAKRHLPEQFEYTVVKLNQRNDAVSFIHCPGFDTEDEPVITAITVVYADGVLQRRTLPSDPYIYHHKWLFVRDDYEGFDVNASRARSKAWEALDDVDRSRIGRLSYWTAYVLPKLRDASSRVVCIERWGTSAQARKELGISTCELAHRRNAGLIKAKKIGRAYYYSLESSNKSCS